MNAELADKNRFKYNFKKRCFYFSLSILQMSKTLKQKNENWILVNQVIRSATSIGANVVEGGNSTSKKEFINYFQIALKSASETLYWLSLLKELNQTTDEINAHLSECTELKKILSTIILNTKSHSRF